MHETLRKYFGYSDFRPLQEEIINDVLNDCDTFVLMPTGGGKSLCYQLPALLKDGITVVVSPLISLMKDQVDSLKENGIDAAYLNSTLKPAQSKRIYEELKRGEIKILYVAPERLTMSGTITLLKSLNVSLFAIDESHCISEWGHDFRPEYRKLDMLKKKFPKIPIIALTATATPKVREDTIKQLGIENCGIYVASFNRQNLFYRVRAKKDTYNNLLQYLRKKKGESGIIYCQSRRTVDSLTKKLLKDGFNALSYHAGLTDLQRSKNQEMFIKDRAEIVVATIAFGMGIDKPNVRFVIHYDLPKNLEGYYQETGRGGRDGLECECVLFFSRGDKYKIEYFIKQKDKKEERDIAIKQLNDMVDYCESNICRRKVLLRYFGEEIPEDNCGKCDVCLQPRIEVDGTAEARLIIKCIQDLNQRFGMNHVIDVLAGSRAKKITDKKHHLLKSFGQGDEYSKNEWLDMAREMVRQDVIKVEGARYPLLKLNRKSLEVLDGKRTVSFTRKVEDVQTEYESVTPDIEEEEFEEDYKPVVHRKISDDPDKILFDKLKELRISLAQMQDVPPYIIFADTSLRQMAARRPATKEEMLKITGVGEYKLKKYGDMFLKAIAEHLETVESSKQENKRSKTKAPVKEEVITKVSGNSIPKPALKKEIVLNALDELEDELIRSIKDKLGGIYSNDEIRNVYQSIIKKK
ncbi:ATP-dependent DNA helicase RecQ [Methanolobus vulcani]|uniref:DNA 3'-5' helicase n=1 Tax=Methanolobus vulcani TaxID=38026 RepID=A0A7Z7FCC3_9EURY|nr:DNA helicase RecQ [Methanolobus vulcani]SDF72896.1 ATP-dependent DNA helicase RecQ [Methanolobus vulcani]